VAEVGAGILGCDGGDSVCHRRLKLLQQSRLNRTEQLFQLRPRWLDGIEIGRVGWKITWRLQETSLL